MNQIILILITGLLFSQVGHTQDNYEKTTKSQYRRYLDGDLGQHGLAGYIAANAGYSGYSSKLNAEGAPMALKLLVSYVTADSLGVIDAGLGWQYQSFTQAAAKESSISSLAIEIAARFQFENKWQLGGVYNQFFNKGFNYGANQADAEFIGLQIIRELSFTKSYLSRIGGRIMTSVNGDGESANMAMVDFQLGWGL